HLDHVHGDADRAALIRDRACDGLANPPGRVSRKLVPAPPVKLLHRAHQSDVPLLNQVKKMQPAIDVVFCDRDYQAKIGLDHLAFGLFDFGLSEDDGLLSSLYIDGSRGVPTLDLADRLSNRALLSL